MVPKPEKTKKSKESILKAATSRSKSKKKWTKGKVKEKAQNAVFFDAAHYEKLLQATAGMKLITVSTLIDKLRINGSLARVAIRHLIAQNLIKVVGEPHHSQYIYTTNVVKKEKKDVAPAAGKKESKKGGKKPAKKEETEEKKEEQA